MLNMSVVIHQQYLNSNFIIIFSTHISGHLPIRTPFLRRQICKVRLSESLFWYHSFTNEELSGKVNIPWLQAHMIPFLITAHFIHDSYVASFTFSCRAPSVGHFCTFSFCFVSIKLYVITSMCVNFYFSIYIIPWIIQFSNINRLLGYTLSLMHYFSCLSCFLRTFFSHPCVSH